MDEIFEQLKQHAKRYPKAQPEDLMVSPNSSHSCALVLNLYVEILIINIFSLFRFVFLTFLKG